MFHPQSFLIYNINIRCLLAHHVELCSILEDLKPHVVCIQETWLNKSVEVKVIPNYIVLSRRDRSEGENRSGILTLVRHDLRGFVHLYNSVVAERSWHYLHLDVGIIAIGNWYRPPGSDISHIESLRDEIAAMKHEVIGLCVTGDMNVHHV